jgi:hypothetical protein
MPTQNRLRPPMKQSATIVDAHPGRSWPKNRLRTIRALAPASDRNRIAMPR